MRSGWLRIAVVAALCTPAAGAFAQPAPPAGTVLVTPQGRVVVGPLDPGRLSLPPRRPPRGGGPVVVRQATVVDSAVAAPAAEDPAIAPTDIVPRLQARPPQSPLPGPAEIDPGESGAFEALSRTVFAPTVGVTLAPGASAETTLAIPAGAAIMGSARWHGAGGPLEVRITLDGREVASRSSPGGSEGGALALTAMATAAGQSRLVLRNGSSAPVDALLILGTVEKD